MNSISKRNSIGLLSSETANSEKIDCQKLLNIQKDKQTFLNSLRIQSVLSERELMEQKYQFYIAEQIAD